VGIPSLVEVSKNGGGRREERGRRV
jgi:hypothetical protein